MLKVRTFLDHVVDFENRAFNIFGERKSLASNCLNHKFHFPSLKYIRIKHVIKVYIAVAGIEFISNGSCFLENLKRI